MLGENSRTPLTRNIHLQIENSALLCLLEALLLEWGYLLTDETESNALLIITEKLSPPAHFRHRLTLSTSHYQGRNQLELPLTIENLYLAIENHFHRTPRNHIRIAAAWPIEVHASDQTFTATTITVADRGLRFVSPREFVRAEEMRISLFWEDKVFELPSRAVYSLRGQEIGRGEQIQVGVVCTPRDRSIREDIRSRIIGQYLQRVRPVLGSNLFAEALRQLNLASMTRIMATEQ